MAPGLGAPGRTRLLAVAGLTLLTLAMFGDVLFSPGQRVASGPYDVPNYFAPIRAFGFGELLRGNLALWNPHLFSGTPYLGGFQAALLYPPNLVYLALPLSKALTVDIALHVLLLGLFMFAWTRNRGLDDRAAFFAAGVLMFSGAFFLRVLAGHLTMLAALAWTPLIFLAVDRLFDRPGLGWCLVGVFAVTMQVLAGLPQPVFCTAVAVALYVALRLLRSTNRMRTLAALGVVAIVPLFLSAAHLWTGLQTAREGTRAGGVSYAFAASYSFPPENLLSLLVPDFFGGQAVRTNWGRSVIWEASAFVGITGIVLALYGALRGERTMLRHAPLLAVVLAVIALGRHTPLFALLFRWVPVFDRFRGPGRFTFHAVFFVAFLSGVGLHCLLRKQTRGSRTAAGTVGAAALLLGVAAIWVHRASTSSAAPNVWADLVNHLSAAGDLVNLNGPSYGEAGRAATQGLLAATVTCLILAALLWFSGRSRWACYGLLALGLIEVFVFARSHRGTTDLSKLIQPEFAAFYRDYPGEHRVIDPQTYSDRVLLVGGYRLWGYDPVQLNRYCEFMAFTQGQTYDQTYWGVNMNRVTFHPLFSMLRFRYLLPMKNSGIGVCDMAPLRRFLLVGDYTVLPDRDAIFAAMEEPTFDAHRTVILETQPKPAPWPDASGGRVVLMDESTDDVTLAIELSQPAILLITDAYSEAWRVTALAPGPQEEYALLPANYILRAVPLAAGRHRIRVEYAPTAFLVGSWVSIVSAVLFLAAVVFCVRRAHRVSDKRARGEVRDRRNGRRLVGSSSESLGHVRLR